MGKDHFLTIAFSDYRTSVENVKLRQPFIHNAPLDDNSKITETASYPDVTEMKLGPNFSKSIGVEDCLWY
ncbi:hypothetical protein TNCV_1685821 [Trichonephila clavipes]|nr:hypothetical protein TNCV_1685821 [Trichonephila clavipes]